LHGYRGARPVRFGNHAYRQRQIGGFGYVADAALAFVDCGGDLRPEHARLLSRIADHVAAHWSEPDSGIWEVAKHQQFLNSKVMSWVTLDRALTLAERFAIGDADARARWAGERRRIHEEVSARGFSDELGAFRECYGASALDSAALLMPVTGFLPADDPRVLATLTQLEERLSIDGFLYRWDPERATDRGEPLGQFEGAFVPLMFWLATALARAGRRDQAAAALATGERAMNQLGLFAEEYDPRDKKALGNFPLLFSHAEHLRALIALA
ncbi:MAG TPA: glycoside hydrolase family 15 protein, partial [Polyangia bacterium]|nr:glycoside hydrolase family 15 protein [Polyangia bacterium]